MFDIFHGEVKGSVVWRWLHKLCIIRHFGRVTNFLTLCFICLYRESQSLGQSIWHLSSAVNLLQIFFVCMQKKVQLNLCGQEGKHSDRYFFCLFLFTESWWACSADLNSLSICLCVCLIIGLYPGGFWSVALLESLSHQGFFYFFFLLIYLQYNCDVFKTIWLIRKGEVKCC